MEDFVDENGESTSPDFTELEESINKLVEVMEADQEMKEQEKLEQQEKEQQAIEDEKLNEETQSETETRETEYKESMASLQESQTDNTENLVIEMQILNENTLLLLESTEKQNELIIESSLTLVIAIVVVVAVKGFIDQITKW